MGGRGWCVGGAAVLLLGLGVPAGEAPRDKGIATMAGVEKKDFGKTKDGTPVEDCTRSRTARA